MKYLLCSLLILQLFSCSAHIANPKVTSVSLSTASLSVDTSNGLVYDENNTLLEKLILNITVRESFQYLINVNGIELDTFLYEGDHKIPFEWSRLLPFDSLVIMTGVDVIPDEQTIIVSTSYITPQNVISLKSEYDHIVEGSSGNFYNENNELLEALVVKVTVTNNGLYTVGVNGIELDTTLLKGIHTLSFQWDEIIPVDTIRITAGVDGENYQQKISIPVIGAYFFNSPYLKYQWNLKAGDEAFMNTWGIDSSAHINIEPVWQSNRGSGVRVAVIDFDIDPFHEDLADNVIATYDAYLKVETLSPRTNKGYHGTMVAGVIGGVSQNEIGIVGVAPEVDLILISERSGFDDAAIRAFEYARDMGAQVINCSWGVNELREPLKDIIREMYESGITVVFAAGNNGADYDASGVEDISELPWVIGVGASTELNDYWDSSAYGAELEILAPGASVNSPAILGLDGMGANGSNRQKELVNENYQFWKGCSFSAPTVAAVVALMYAENPDLTPDQIRSYLIQSADKVGGVDASYNSNGYDQRRFYGKLNAYKAVMMSRN